MANFNALVDDRARAYFSQASDEEYLIYLTALNKKLKLIAHDEPVNIGGVNFAAIKEPDLEPVPAAKA